MAGTGLTDSARVRLRGELVLGLSLIGAPLLAYPGNWVSSAPETPAQELGWSEFGILVYLGLAVGFVLVFHAIRATLAGWTVSSIPSRRRALARCLRSTSNRPILALAAAGYALFFAAFAALYSFALTGPGIVMPAYPGVTNVLCCGPAGYTPVVALVVTPHFELVVYPLVLVLLVGSTSLFAVNIVAATELLRQPAPRAPSSGGLILGSLGAALVNCPACGTILAWNALSGSAAAGLLVGWVTYQTPLLLAAFPLSLVALVWNAHQLNRRGGMASCPRPSNGVPL